MPIHPICSHLAKKWRSRKWPNTPGSDWYYGGKFQGRLRGWHTFHVIVGVAYLVTCLLPLLHFGWHIVFGKGHTAQATVHWLLVDRWWIGLPWLVITSVGLPLFVWAENLAFSTWLASAKVSRRKKIKLKERFDLNSKHMEATWKSVAGLYLVGGLLSFSNFNNGNQKKSETETLAGSIDRLANIVGKSKAQPQDTETRRAIESLAHATRSLAEVLQKSPLSTPVPPLPQPPSEPPKP